MSAETSAVRAMRRAADALVARDVAGYADVIDEDYVYEDRRTGLQTSHGKGKDLEQARVIVDFDIEHYDLEVLETRGDLTALYRQTWQLAGFEVVILLVGRVNDEGKAVATVMFDEGDLDAARAELEAQAAAS